MSSAQKTGASAVEDVLAAALNEDPSVLLLGEDRASDVADEVGRRLVLPISDRATLGFALGLAYAGRRPVVSLASSSRLPALQEVLVEAGLAALRGDSVPIVIRVPYGTEAVGLDRPVGGTLAGLAGVRVVCASSPAMLAGLLRWALAGSAPTLLLEPRSVLTDRGPVDSAAVPPHPRLIREGRHVTLAAWGAGVAVASDAAQVLAREGIEADVIDLVSLAPLDREVLGDRVRATGRLVVVHEDDPVLARQVHEVAIGEAFLHLEAPLAASGAESARVLAAARDAVHF